MLEQPSLKALLKLFSDGHGQPQGSGVLGQLGGAPVLAQAELFDDPLVLANAEQVQSDEAVLALVHANTAEVDVASASARPLDALVEEVDQVVLAHVHDALIHCPVDALALAGAIGLAQCSQGGSNEQVGVDVVTGVRHGNHRLLSGAVLAGEASVRANGAVVGRTLDAVGVAEFTVAGAVDDDELGVNGPHILIGEALALPRAALGGLEEDVGVLEHLQQNFFALGGELVQSDGAAVTTLGLSSVLSIANGVAIARVLEPRNIGTPVSHDVASARNSFLHCSEDDFDVVENTKARFFGRNGSHIAGPFSFLRVRRALTRRTR